MPLQRDWRIINHVLNSARYEMAVASIPISQVGVSPVNLASSPTKKTSVLSPILQACDADII